MSIKRKGRLFGVFVLLTLSLKWTPFDQPTLPADFLLIAHRGASAYAPEHTLSAYQLAFDLDADYIEIDLQQTQDGVLVAFHDETIERTTNGTGAVSDYTYEELKALDAGSWFNEAFPEQKQFQEEGIVRLEDIVDEFGKEAKYYIETKQPFTDGQLEGQLVQLLEEYGLLENVALTRQVILQSFSEESLLRLHDLDPDIPLIHLYHFKKEPAELSADEFDKLASYASGIGVNQSALTRVFGDQAAEWELDLHVYTINTYSEAIDAYKKGADGLFTDNLLEFIDQLDDPV